MLQGKATCPSMCTAQIRLDRCKNTEGDHKVGWGRKKCEWVDLGWVERCECTQNTLGGALNELIKTEDKTELRKFRYF